MELALDVPRPLTPLAWRNAQGSVRLTMGPGVIPQFDLSALRTLAAQKPYFPLSEAASTDLPFQSLNVTADLQNGSADIRSGEIATTEETITLAGVIPYVNNSLALSATVRPLNEVAQPFGFFIGGSWPDPVIWPLPQAQPKPGD
jgi:AsmA protein